MRKYLKRKNKAVAVIAIALLMACVFTIAVGASPTYDVVETITPDTNGFYKALNTYPKGTIFRLVIDGSNGDNEIICVPDDYISYTNAYNEIIGTVDEIVSFHVYECYAEDNLTCSHTEGCVSSSISSILERDFKSVGGSLTLQIVEERKSTMGGLVGDMFSTFGDVIDGLTDGIKGLFNNILWIDGTSQSGLSHFAKFGFVMAGLSLALGLGYVIISKIGR